MDRVKKECCGGRMLYKIRTFDGKRWVYNANDYHVEFNNEEQKIVVCPFSAPHPKREFTYAFISNIDNLIEQLSEAIIA